MSFFSKEHFWQLSLYCLSGLLLLPILAVFTAWFSPVSDGLWSHLSETVLFSYIWHSLALMCLVAMLSLFLGLIPAWFVTMYRFPGSRILQWGLLLPMSMPAYIIAYTYTGILDVAGPLQHSLRQWMGWSYQDYWFPEIRSLGGAVILLSLVLYPYVYLLARSAFLSQSVCVLEVSRTLGYSAWRAFYKVALPLARPAMIVGVTLVMMETLADYGTVQYFGLPVLTTGIFRIWFGLDSGAGAAQLSTMMMIFVLILIQVESWSRREERFYHTSSRYSQLHQLRPAAFYAWQMTLVCSLPVFFGFLIPVYFLIRWALDSYPSVLDESFYQLVLNSFGISCCAALAVLGVAIFLAYGKRHFPFPMVKTLTRFASIGYAVPGAVIAIGVMLPFTWLDSYINIWLSKYFNIKIGLLLSGTLVMLIFAYVVRFLAIPLNAMDAALTKIKPSMDEIGRLSGISPFKMLRRIHIPMIRGTVLTAGLLVFVDVLKELPATLILRPFNFNTLAVKTYELANEERLAEAACPSLLLIFVGILPVILISYSIANSRPGYASRT